MTRTQKGFSLTSFMMILAVAGVIALFAMKLIPMYIEFNAVKSAMDALQGQEFESATEVKEALTKRFSTNYVDSVKREDIDISSKNGGYEVSVDYYVEKPLFDRISLTGHFDHTVQTK